ncbi:molybdate ABC transporter substrate-binding protein [Fictibacillus nanhaiensis]|uniref:molybdate ABC transporter substrate-binding protein n=1 Tax=Fictibacillus nanhaiensis TaxID=742169 RepID=UPI001C955E5D|nr:molybdate ABC transporter substrate-binding protein [Fictibacillus nanhaiensis]MBY6035377.1 molybdate ABC transporter substrate-binding protein [Fictibacillus nanhaiensis]
MRRTTSVYIILIIIASLLMGCKKPEKPPETVLYISAASSLKGPVKDWIKQFEEDHPHVHIAANFGASGVLLNQIKKGAPADLVFSAQAIDHYVPSGSTISFKEEGIIASNELVFVAGKRLNSPVRSVKDLPADAKLGIGDPKWVPAGFYAEKVLEHLNKSLDEIRFSQNAVHLKGLVENGAVDYAIMYKTDAVDNKHLTILETIPESMYPVIEYPLYVVNSAKKDTKDFIQYVQSAEGQLVLRKYHFRESVKN